MKAHAICKCTLFRWRRTITAQTTTNSILSEAAAAAAPTTLHQEQGLRALRPGLPRPLPALVTDNILQTDGGDDPSIPASDTAERADFMNQARTTNK